LPLHIYSITYATMFGCFEGPLALILKIGKKDSYINQWL